MDLKTFRENYQKDSEKFLDTQKTALPDKDFILIECLLEINWRLRHFK